MYQPKPKRAVPMLLPVSFFSIMQRIVLNVHCEDNDDIMTFGVALVVQPY